MFTVVRPNPLPHPVFTPYRFFINLPVAKKHAGSRSGVLEKPYSGTFYE